MPTFEGHKTTRERFAKLIGHPAWSAYFVLLHAMLFAGILLFDGRPLPYTYRLPAYALSDPCGEEAEELPFEGPISPTAGLASLPRLTQGACVRIALPQARFVNQLVIQASTASSFAVGFAAGDDSFENVQPAVRLEIPRNFLSFLPHRGGEVSIPANRFIKGIEIRPDSAGYISNVAMVAPSMARQIDFAPTLRGFAYGVLVLILSILK